jgi:hypothetical protein
MSSRMPASRVQSTSISVATHEAFDERDEVDRDPGHPSVGWRPLNNTSVVQNSSSVCEAL